RARAPVHVDAVLRADLDAEVAEEALVVVDAELLPGEELLLDAVGLHLDALDGADLRALEAEDARLLVERVEAAVPLRDDALLLRVLHRGLGPAQVLPRDLHALHGRLQAVHDVADVGDHGGFFVGSRSRPISRCPGRNGRRTRRSRPSS